jgi:hypothetical protein
VKYAVDFSQLSDDGVFGDIGAEKLDLISHGGQITKRTVRQIIQYSNFVTYGNFFNQMRPDKTGSAGNDQLRFQKVSCLCSLLFYALDRGIEGGANSFLVFSCEFAVQR